MKILFIQTGGTIDKDYPKSVKAYAFEIEEAAVSRIMENVAPNFEFEVLSLLKKDSLDLTDDDRVLIKETCQNTSYTHIIITHGSDTMPETGRAIGNIKGKTIVLVGAYRPERFSNSDAHFNIGVAVGALNILENGTFIAMNGNIMSPDNCRKNPETGQFEAN
jgi:L-asparaginase